MRRTINFNVTNTHNYKFINYELGGESKNEEDARQVWRHWLHMGLFFDNYPSRRRKKKKRQKMSHGGGGGDDVTEAESHMHAVEEMDIMTSTADSVVDFDIRKSHKYVSKYGSEESASFSEPFEQEFSFQVALWHSSVTTYEKAEVNIHMLKLRKKIKKLVFPRPFMETCRKRECLVKEMEEEKEKQKRFGAKYKSTKMAELFAQYSWLEC